MQRIEVLYKTKEKTTDGRYLHMFKCFCGNEFKNLLKRIRSKNTKSCGCLNHLGNSTRTHGDTFSPEYNSWYAMKRRCLNKNTIDYKTHGKRGIIVCPEWLNSYETFLKDMGRKPSKKHSLDRIDNNGPYSPDNCRWATPIEQGRNKRNNRIISFYGLSMCTTAWEEFLGWKRDTLKNRLLNGWDLTRALTQPLKKRK